MSGEMSRREFLSRRGLGEVFRKVTPMLGIKTESEQLDATAEKQEVKEPETIAIEERTVMEGYLSSPLYSYALLSEMPWICWLRKPNDGAFRMKDDQKWKWSGNYLLALRKGRDRHECRGPVDSRRRRHQSLLDGMFF